MKIIFITWANFNSRSKSISDSIGSECYFIGRSKKSSNPFINFLSYPNKIVKNISIIRNSKPDIVIVSNTQLFITLVNYLLSLFLGFNIVLDSHSSAFDHPFFKYPTFLSFFFARKAQLSLVTNQKHFQVLKENGAKAFVLTDMPSRELEKAEGVFSVSEKFNVCFVCTFSEDEPLEEFFKAANELDEVEFYVTGNSARLDKNIKVSSNVNVTGFLDRSDYDSLICSVDAIMCLTTRHDTMQRGGSEAISVGKPLITSDTKMLRDYFRKGTSFVKPVSESIIEGVEFTMKEKNLLEKQMKELRNERKARFETILENLLIELK